MQLAQKPKIVSSHLALRFYRSNGWTEDLVKSCMDRGPLKFNDDQVGGQDWAYWVLECGSRFNVDRLLEVAGPVFDFHDKELRGEEAREYVSRMNW